MGVKSPNLSLYYTVLQLRVVSLAVGQFIFSKVLTKSSSLLLSVLCPYNSETGIFKQTTAKRLNWSGKVHSTPLNKKMQKMCIVQFKMFYLSHIYTSSQKYCYYRRSIGDPSKTYWRPIGDPWETHRRPSGDLLVTLQKPTCLIWDTLQTKRRLIIRPIGDLIRIKFEDVKYI